MLEGGAWWGDGVVGVLVDTPEGCGYNTGSTGTHEVAFSVCHDGVLVGGGAQQTGIGRNTVCRQITAGYLQAGLLYWASAYLAV